MTQYYKAFDRDYTCRGFKFEEGETYMLPGNPVLCGYGFHFCKDLVLTLQYYPTMENNRYAIVEALGQVVFAEPNKHKGCTNKIKIVRFLTDEEVKAMVDDKKNSGYENSGKYNSGDRNSGKYNSGCENSGYCNSGDYNSGNYNSGDRNSGHRNPGRCNSGTCNSGNWNSGYRNSGNYNSGDRNSGNGNSGSYNSGNYNSGNCNSIDLSNGFFNTEQKEVITIDIFNKPVTLTLKEYVEVKEITLHEVANRIHNGLIETAKTYAEQLPNYDEQTFYQIVKEIQSNEQ